MKIEPRKERPLDPDLISHSAQWMRRLASGLLFEGVEADDLVQDAWVAALETPPSQPGVQSWFATVLRRRASHSRRSGGRRRRREAKVAEPGIQEPVDLLEQTELSRKVHELVLALSEPYRETILMRYFQDLTPREIAERQGVAEATVRSRVHRALALLRERLDGERSDWVPALLPLALSEVARTAVPSLVVAGGGITMITKTALVLVAAVGIFLALYWPETKTERKPEASPSVAGHSEEPRRSEVPAATAPEPVPAPPSISPAAAEETIACEIILRTDSGDVTPSSGEVAIALGEDQRALEIIDGRTEIPRSLSGARLEFQELTLEGSPATIDERYAPTVRDPSWLLIARPLFPVRLEVRDAVTGHHARRLQILRDVPAYRDRVHPPVWPNESQLYASVDSPLELPSHRGLVDYWLRAPGYPWTVVSVDHREGGERVIEITPDCASLEVTLHHAVDPALRLRLYEPGEGRRKLRADLAAADRVRFDNLPPGSYRIVAEIGMPYDRPSPLAEEDVVLAAGEERALDITVADSPYLGATRRLDGVLEVPPSGRDLTYHATLRPLELPPVTEHTHRFRLEPGANPGQRPFSIEAIVPGRYLLRIDPIQWAVAVDVSPRDGTPCVVELPEIGEVIVELVEKSTGLPAEITRLSHGITGASEFAWYFETVKADDEGRFHVRAPVGSRQMIDLLDPGYVLPVAAVIVEAGVTERVIEVDDALGIDVILRDRGTVVPFPTGVTAVAQRAGSPRRHYGNAIQDSASRIRVSEPGTYRVEVEPIPGYQLVPPMEVELRPGEITSVTVDLERR